LDFAAFTSMNRSFKLTSAQSNRSISAVRSPANAPTARNGISSCREGVGSYN
jgi:hypothetical protein